MGQYMLLLAGRAAQPQDGHEGMRIGLDTFRSSADQTLWALLMQPGRPSPGTLVSIGGTS